VSITQVSPVVSSTPVVQGVTVRQTPERGQGSLTKHYGQLLHTPTQGVNRYLLQEIGKALMAASGQFQRYASCMKGVTREIDIRRKGEGNAYFHGVWRCGLVWVCPVCASRIVRERRNELAEGVKASGLTPVMATLTIQHNAGGQLKELLRVLGGAWGRLTGDRWWQEFRGRYAVRHFVSSKEIRVSAETGWHPHLHILLLCEGMPNADAMRGELAERWAFKVAGRGGYASVYHGVEVVGGDAGLASYLFKWDAVSELVMGAYKAGRTDSYSPFQLLLKSLDDPQAGRWFVEYARSTFGMRQLNFSKGMRKALTIGDGVEELPEGWEVLARLAREAYNLLRVRGKSQEMLDVASQHGQAGIDALIGQVVSEG